MIIHRKEISIVVLIIILVGAISFYVGRNGASISTEEIETQSASSSLVVSTTTKKEETATSSSIVKPKAAATTPSLSSGNTKGFNSYGSAPYHFTIKYPTYVQVRNGFSTFHEIGNNWRLYPSAANQGKSVVSFVVHAIDQGVYSTGKQSYPLYFTAEVRVGVSENVKECYTPDAMFPNQKISSVTINGVPFKKFSTFENNTPKYTQAESYRTIRNNLCYAIEQIRSGTTYRDASMQPGVTDATLMGYYNIGETIVKTFAFTK